MTDSRRLCVLLLGSALILPAVPAGATVEMQNQAKKLGFAVKNCLDCHGDFDAILRKPFVHTPVKGKDCAGCHNPHSGAIDVGRRGRNCNACHGTVVTADDIGTLPGKATVANALALLLAGIESYAENNPDTPCIVFDEASYPYWFTDENCDGTVGDNDTAYAAWTPRLVKAAYNYQVGLKDSGAWAHNKPYILAILASSLADLGLSGYVNP